MEVKKTKQADMTTRSPLYFLIGLNIVLLVTFLALELTRKYSEKEVIEKVEVPEITDEDVIITERQFDEPPPPVETPAPPEIPVEVETVEDDVVLEDPPPVADLNKPDVPPPTTHTAPSAPRPTGPPPVKAPPAAAPKATVDDKVNRATAKQAMIYPGCEKYKGNNRELYQCFNDKFGADLGSNLDMFELDAGEKPRQVLIQFEIDKNGNLKITGSNSRGAEESFKSNAINAFQRLSAQMERKARKGKGIQPALNSNDEPAVMEYSIPITFRPQN